MDLKITGKVKQVLQEQSGKSQNGPWRKQDFILETGGQYPRPVCVTQWGDKIDEFDIQEGEELTAYIDIQSREYNGRWYTDVKAWKIEKGSPNNGSTPPSQGDDLPPFDLSDSDEDIPF